MRKLHLLARLALPVILLAAAASPALADTGGGGADLGLDAMTVTSATVNGRTGIATLSGTISCSQDLDGVFVGAELDQVVGRFTTLRGWGGTMISCSAADGTAAWSTSFGPDQGKFAAGSGTVSGYAEAGSCTDVDCFFDIVFVGPQTMHLGH
jgi:hypothetical protein